jgi:hypothetical protein
MTYFIYMYVCIFKNLSESTPPENLDEIEVVYADLFLYLISDILSEHNLTDLTLRNCL